MSHWDHHSRFENGQGVLTLRNSRITGHTFFDFLDYFPISPKTFFIWKDVGPLFWGLDEYLSIMHGLYKDHVW
jgi:hypothetical protein